MTDLELHLLNDFQRDFPLVHAPFGVLAERLGVSETEVLKTLTQLQTGGKVSRVGAVFKPHSIGYSTLAALAVPAGELDGIAALVNGYIEVNHNYEREHHYNLWFVITAVNEARVLQVLSEIERRTGYEPLYLPMLEDFHIDLGFDLSRSRKGHSVETIKCTRDVSQHTPHTLSKLSEVALIGAIQCGLSLVSRPFAELGANIGLAENDVIAGFAQLVEQGVIKRMGVVVRHHELGYRANAMVVWDIPDEQVSALGHRIGSFDFVTLCYRRPRQLPTWPYNLFTMIHGQHRDDVLNLVAQLKEQCGLQDVASEVLFSSRCFKQCGARYVVNPIVEPVNEQRYASA
ncbi:MAG TPA: Lrp/AsnC family transcriptional regulator [Gallionellaceae bacterium]|nr:Lrp/AsnC family transcriptional regulator [Gallionellaceae bacterium]